MGRFIFVAYTSLMPFLTLAYIIYLIFTPRRGRLAILGGELRERLSISLPDIPAGSIWFHAASMGEVKAISVLAPRLAESLGRDFFITTSTATGKKEALKLTKNAWLMPIDFYFFTKRFIKKTRPSMLINAETEIWPAAFVVARQNNIPIYMASARISQGTFNLYKRLSPLTSFIFEGVKKTLCQSEDDASRFRQLKGLQDKVIVTGNLKYDQNPISADNTDVNKLMTCFNPDNSPVFAAGCTHPEEEPIILQGYLEAAKKIPNLKIVIAPRHLEQIHLAKKNIENAGIRYAVWPDMQSDEITKMNVPALLVNKTGVLQSIYRHSTICLVGGTLDNTGGHNLLEPALFGKPVLFGPNYRTARLAGNELARNKGGFIVHNSQEITDLLANLCNCNDLLANACKNSAKTLKSLQGATERTLRQIN